jgi:serine/threonine-protein kinase
MVEVIMNSELKQTPLEVLDCETIHIFSNVEQRERGRRATDNKVATGVRVAEETPLTFRSRITGKIVLMSFAAFSLGFTLPLYLHSAWFASTLGLLLIGSSVAGMAIIAARRNSLARMRILDPQLIGQYRLLSLIGRGGMGEVYLAQHHMLERLCAIKLIRPERACDTQALARFEREVRMTARLSHWNTVKIFDYGRTADGTFYYVMEYLPGLSFEEIIETHGPQPAARVVQFLRQACHALREAHSMGLVHRDIKPGNLLAARYGGLFDVVKLLDFGLVQPAAGISSTRLTEQGVVSGTPLFMSPEQATGIDVVDGRSDIYSLGAVAYALLTGQAPFERSTPMEVLIAHARDAVTPPSELANDMPADLEKIVLRCLAKKPEDRYQDVDALERSLGRCTAADQWTQSRATRWWMEHRRVHETTGAKALSLQSVSGIAARAS